MEIYVLNQDGEGVEYGEFFVTLFKDLPTREELINAGVYDSVVDKLLEKRTVIDEYRCFELTKVEVK